MTGQTMNNAGGSRPAPEARVLGQILAAQNLVFILPDNTHIAEFYAEILRSLPGVSACRVCLGDVSVQSGEMNHPTCAACEASRHAVVTGEDLVPVAMALKCGLADQPDMVIVALASPLRHFGFFICKINDMSAFAVYKPFIGNLADFIVLALERRLHEKLLQKGRDELASTVEERTRELSLANETLSEDVAVRERAEAELAKANRVLRMLSNCNGAMARVAEEAALLDVICRIVVEIGGYRMAWVALAEQDEARSVRPAAWAGYEAGYLDSANITWADTPFGRCPTGIAIRTGQPSISRDIMTDAAFAPWRDAAIARGYRSAIALPLLGEGRAFGALVVYADTADAFDDEEVSVLKELADNLAFGITALRLRIQHEQAEEQLRNYVSIIATKTQTLQERTASLETAMRAKDEFIAKMSHELRTPLNAIVGFSDGLLERRSIHPLSDHQADRLAKIKQSGDHLVSLVNDVLDIAKVEAGRMQFQSTTFDLVDLARETADMAETLLQQRPEISFQLDVEEHLPPITTDRDKLRQICFNLVGNAVKFTPRGTVTLRMRRDGERALLEVEDTGIGIAADQQESIFGKFYQVRRSIPGSLKGTGLGLSICRALAALLGGVITVRSTVGQGSTFTVAVPLNPTQPDDAAARDMAELARAQCAVASGDGSRPKILCIDADPIGIMLVNDYLTEAGFCVIPAFDCPEGLRLVDAEHPQAILLDVMLSASKGWQLLRQWKADPATADIPVIVITAEDEKPLGIALGASDYLVKPINKDNLLRAIRREVAPPARQAESLTQAVSVEPYFRSADMRHVLLVEDNPMNQAAIEDIFRYDDVPGELVCVDNAEDALRILPSLNPLVVLMDLMLPGMSGIEATRIIKSNPATKRIPVWAVTACVARRDIDEALAAGCNGYFTKPVAARALAEQLRVFQDEEIHNLEPQSAT